MATPHIEVKPAAGTTNQKWRTLASVPEDTSGRLKGIGVVHTEGTTSHIRVKLNGNELIQNKIGSSSSDCGNDGMILDLPFFDGMTVEIADKSQVKPQTRYWASYVVFDDNNDA